MLVLLFVLLVFLPSSLSPSTRLKDDASRKQRIALEGGALTSALKAKFDELPETIEELDVEMQRAQSKVYKNMHFKLCSD